MPVALSADQVFELAGLAVGLFWELIKGEKQFGVMAIIVGSLASIIVFLIVVAIERKAGVPYAPSAYPDAAKAAEEK